MVALGQDEGRTVCELNSHTVKPHGDPAIAEPVLRAGPDPAGVRLLDACPELVWLQKGTSELWLALPAAAVAGTVSRTGSATGVASRSGARYLAS